MNKQQVTEVIEYLSELKEEPDCCKRFKEKAASVITILSSDVELPIEKALMELEDLNNIDMPSYNRTQVWDVISMLESAK